MKTLSYEERQEKELDDKYELFVKIQEKLKKEKINLYGFEIHIIEPTDENSLINTDRGFFTSAHLTFKGISFGRLNPDFQTKLYKTTHDSFYITGYNNEPLGSINYYRSQMTPPLPEIQVQRKDHKCLQTFIDEMEKFRQEIVKFYSI